MKPQDVTRATFTIGEVAILLGLARSTAYDLAARNCLPVPTIRAGRRLLVSRAALERVLAGEARGNSRGEFSDQTGQHRFSAGFVC
jgi:excisionase family DNA binding protein